MSRNDLIRLLPVKNACRQGEARPQPPQGHSISFRRNRLGHFGGITALELEYETHVPVHLGFRVSRGLQVHLRQRGTGRYTINNGAMIEGNSTELQFFCGGSPWAKDVYEASGRSPRILMFGLTESDAGNLLGRSMSDAIFGFANDAIYHSCVTLRNDLSAELDDVFDTGNDGISGLRRDARLIQLLASSLEMTREVMGSSSNGYRARPSDVMRLQGVIGHIERNPAGDITVEKLAALAGMSVSRFKGLFREHTGLPVATFVRRQRMAVAAGLLRDGMMIGEVALRVGFAHAGHFSRVFRETHGVNPLQFAAMNKAN